MQDQSDGATRAPSPYREVGRSRILGSSRVVGLGGMQRSGRLPRDAAVNLRCWKRGERRIYFMSGEEPMTEAAADLLRAVRIRPGIRPSEAAPLIGVRRTYAGLLACQLRRAGLIEPADYSGELRPVNVQRTLRRYVEEHGPCRASEAVSACFPHATERERAKAASALAVDAREGRLDRLAYGLYDRKIV